MDNNFNQQAPQQPVYQQAPQQMPQQQMYQQAPQQQMYQQPMYQPAPKKPSNINTMELLALILSSVGAFMAILGSIMTCSCSASKTMTITNIMKNSSDGKIHSASAVLWVAIIGAFVAAAGEGSVIEILYTAIVDTDATIDSTPNINTAYMLFGETKVAGDETVLTQQRTVDKITNTYSWSFGIDKFHNKDNVATHLAGAKFKLYTENPVTNPNAVAMKFVYDSTVGYRLADTYRDKSGVSDVITSTTSGNDRILGLDNITYYLVETEAPSGFNKLGAPIVVTISSSQVANVETQLTKLVTAKQGTANVTVVNGDVIPVLNQAGLVLPSTGGYTQIFIIVGCLMVMSMGMLLVVRKRMTKVIYIRNDAYYEEYED